MLKLLQAGQVLVPDLRINALLGRSGRVAICLCPTSVLPCSRLPASPVACTIDI